MPTFDDRAAEWDTPDRVARAEAVADALVRAIAVPVGTRAIELGAGTGLLGLAIRDRVGPARLVELLLTDPSSGMLDGAERKIEAGGPRWGGTPQVHVVGGPP